MNRMSQYYRSENGPMNVTPENSSPTRNPDNPETANEKTHPPAALSHIDEHGAAHMVDVGDKSINKRSATASAVVKTRPDVIAMISQPDPFVGIRTCLGKIRQCLIRRGVGIIKLLESQHGSK